MVRNRRPPPFLSIHGSAADFNIKRMFLCTQDLNGKYYIIVISQPRSRLLLKIKGNLSEICFEQIIAVGDDRDFISYII